MRTHTIIESPIGDLTLVADDSRLSGLYMEQHKRRPAISTMGSRAPIGFESVQEQLNEYFAGDRTEFTFDLAPDGDAFQRQVWDRLKAIPYGETRSYGAIAKELGDRSLAQAVGAANALNPIAIVVPCHRVIGADGKLVGYAGGLERKEFLLGLENPDRAIARPLF
ncbi:methylated-DNA--[protein]-cysteine S-methyltransferase [soil metagenome]